ncbi:MAG: cation:proton antiporter [Aminivibrio sp.]|jgi:CPA2 family monovalent cation:H+ antiporter-2|nr:portal protein [Synergistaceae bacterium]
MEIAIDLIIVVAAGLFGGIIARKLNQPLIFGYIVAGIIIGPYTGGISISDPDQIAGLAEIGAALLLFSLGLEFSMKSIASIRGVTIGGGAIQVFFTLFVGYFLARYITGWSSVPATWYAVSIVSSSTSVIMKTVASRGQMGTLSSRVMIGMSIVQDILVLPLMVLLIGLLGTEITLLGIMSPVLKVLVFVAVMVYAGSRAIPLVLKYVAEWESQELFILTVTALGLSVGYLTYAFGLSFAFGAFMAGLVLSESDYGKRTLSDISSLRDVFSLLFFVSIGMLLDPGVLKSHLVATVLLMVATTLSRGAILSALTYIFGYRNVIPLAAFLTMTPISEIAFIVLQAGMTLGAVGKTEYSIALNAVVLSMIFGPLVSGLVSPIYRAVKKRGVIAEVSSINLPRGALADHVVLAGGRSLARYLGTMLARFSIPYVIIESNHANFLIGKEEGLSMLLGDPAQDVVLEAAEVQDARLVVMTTSENMGTVEAIRSIRRHNSEVPILAWAAEQEDVTILKNHGVRHIVEPDFEASVEMARQTLTRFGMPATSVHREVGAMRRAMYGHLFEQFREYEDMNGLQSSTNMISLEWVFIHKGNPVAGKRLADSNIRETLGVSVAAIHRSGGLIPSPGGDFELHEGDYIGVVGTPEQNRLLVEFFKKPAAK